MSYSQIFWVDRVGANNSTCEDIFACETRAPYPELRLDCDFDIKLIHYDRKHPSSYSRVLSGNSSHDATQDTMNYSIKKQSHRNRTPTLSNRLSNERAVVPEIRYSSVMGTPQGRAHKTTVLKKTHVEAETEKCATPPPSAKGKFAS